MADKQPVSNSKLTSCHTETLVLNVSISPEMDGNIFQRAYYYWRLKNVVLYNPSYSQLVQDILDGKSHSDY